MKLSKFECEVLRLLSEFIRGVASDIDIAIHIYARRNPGWEPGVIGLGGAAKYKLAANQALYRLKEKSLTHQISGTAMAGITFTITPAGRAALEVSNEAE